MGDQCPAAAFLTVGEAGASHGVYFRDEFEAFGMGARDRRAAISAGTLTSPRKDWTAVEGHDPNVAAAVKAGGVLSCVSALKRYGFWVPPGYPDSHVRKARIRTDQTCRGFSPIASGRTAVDSIVTALECAVRCMAEEDWIAVCDSIQEKLGISAESLRSEIGALPKHVIELFGKTDGRSQSGTESIARVRLRAQHFKVVVQPQITELARSDLRIGRLILECDGTQYHSDPESYQKDRTRDRKATVGQWLTFRLTYDDVLFGWKEVLEDIRAITRADRHRIRRAVTTPSP